MRLTDPIPGEPWHQRVRRERQAREAVQPRRKARKPTHRPLPKDWTPPF